ncbi:MAG: hypothetical protein ACI8RD_007418, partial [Bacillariaceae sp.]
IKENMVMRMENLLLKQKINTKQHYVKHHVQNQDVGVQV